jgi:hypothetical protein
MFLTDALPCIWAAEFKLKADVIEEQIEELKKQGSNDTVNMGKLKRLMTAKVSIVCPYLNNLTTPNRLFECSWCRKTFR